MNRQALRRLEALEKAAKAKIHVVECDVSEPIKSAKKRAGIEPVAPDITLVVHINYEPNP